jgi:putative transposase
VDAMRATDGQPEALYGRRKMTSHLRRQGHPVAGCTVDRLMRDEHRNGARRGGAHRTTIGAKDGVRAGDRLNRDFTAEAPNARWVADSPIAAPGPGSSMSRS